MPHHAKIEVRFSVKNYPRKVVFRGFYGIFFLKNIEKIVALNCNLFLNYPSCSIFASHKFVCNISPIFPPHWFSFNRHHVSPLWSRRNNKNNGTIVESTEEDEEAKRRRRRAKISVLLPAITIDRTESTTTRRTHKKVYWVLGRDGIDR